MKEESERAAETSTFNYHKQRGIKAEIKQYEEQKSEAERYERTMEERVTALLIKRINIRIKQSLHIFSGNFFNLTQVSNPIAIPLVPQPVKPNVSRMI